MSTLSPAAKPLERIANDPYWLRQFSVVEYHKMVESGILTSNDRVELLEGCTKPRAGKYQKKVEYSDKNTVPLVLDGLKVADIPVRELIAKS
jgi:hypothetical protein